MGSSFRRHNFKAASVSNAEERGARLSHVAVGDRNCWALLSCGRTSPPKKVPPLAQLRAGGAGVELGFTNPPGHAIASSVPAPIVHDVLHIDGSECYENGARPAATNKTEGVGVRPAYGKPGAGRRCTEVEVS
jgi:hypothetical protein